MKIPRLAALFLTIITGTAPAAEDTEPLRVFIFAGQSNMVGADAHADRIDHYPPFKGAGAPQEDVLFTSLPGGEPEAPAGWGPLHPRDAFGPEVTFARFLKAHDKSRIAIIKSSIGGTTVAYDWNPDAPETGQKLYPRTLKLIQDSLRELDRRGLRHRLEAVMWHQGENDMLDSKLNVHYAERLTRLIGRLRKDLGTPELKWFLAEASEKGIWGMDHRGHLAVLRQQQDTVIKADPLLRWVPASHLAFDVMDGGQPHYHFGTQGQLQLGEAFAAAWLDAAGKPVSTKEPSFKDGLPLVKGRPVRLFVLAGQRNMEGEDSFTAEIPQQGEHASLAGVQEQIAYRYSLGGGVKISPAWQPLAPVNYLGNFGPELSLGAALQKSPAGHGGIAIVKFTHSGAQAPDWFPDGSPESRRNLYPAFISFIRDAVDDLTRQGYACTLAGVFWHTGENDTWFEPSRRNYAAWMQNLISRTRQDLKSPALPWFISEQHPKAVWGNIEAMNDGLRKMAASAEHIVMVPTSHLPHGRTHFGTKGTLLLGEEYAKAWLRANR